jgi:hypothetical protein
MFVRCLGILLPVMAALLWADAAAAKVVRFEIQRSEPYGSFRAGDFVRIEARAVGELAADEAIPGLDRAPRNARGRVEYATPVTIIAPKAPGGNGALLFDVANRGRAVAHGLYNSPREKFLALGSFEAGTGFLEDRGFTVVMAAWELGQQIELPSFTDQDGKTRYAEGVGIAAIRDIVDFLHHAAADEAGNRNPLAGSINRTLAIGYSQTARLLKAMMIDGFNRAEGRRVFDGLHLQGGASGLATVLVAGSGPQSSTFLTPRFTDLDLRGVHEEPFAYEDIIARMTARGEVPPKILVTNMTTDYFSIRASLARTGSSGTVERTIPENVRIYDVAGASHGRSRAAGCEMPRGVLDWSPVMRAVLARLDLWVGRNRMPPASVLMPLEARPQDESVLGAPAHLPQAVVQVPKQDADGNFVGGVRLPDVEAPLGVHGVQNRPLSDRSCNLDAAYIAFAKKPAERAAGDTRPAISERYQGHADYLNRIRVAARRLIEQGLLLPEDGWIIVNTAAQTAAFD